MPTEYTTENRVIRDVEDIINQLQIVITQCQQAKNEIRIAGRNHILASELTTILGNHSDEIQGRISEAAEQLANIIGLSTTAVNTASFDLAPALIKGCPPDFSRIEFSQATGTEPEPVMIESNDAASDGTVTGPAGYPTSGSKPLTTMFADGDIILFEETGMTDDEGRSQRGFAYEVGTADGTGQNDKLTMEGDSHDYQIAQNTRKFDDGFVLRLLYDANP